MPAKSPFCVFPVAPYCKEGGCAFLDRHSLSATAGPWQSFFLLIFCCSFSAVAELTWEEEVIRLDVHPLQVEGKGEFRFKNSGTNTVDIVAVRTTCGCMKASASTNQVAPGESGTIDVVFNYREKTGPQRNAVAVRTSESTPVILYVEANIPSAYSLSAQRLDWKLSSVAVRGEDGQRNLYESQTCRLINHTQTPFDLVAASSSSDQFTVELIPIREGFEYEVVVTPASSITESTAATITVQAECPPEIPESRVYTFKVVVR